MSETNQDGFSSAELPGAGTGWASLRAEREARGLSIGHVSAHLKLTPRQIEAIERGDFSVLPGFAFSKGFVRNYARFLELDPSPFLALVDASEGRESAGIPTQMYTPSLGRMPTSGNPRFSALPAILLTLVLAAVLGSGWYFHWFEAREDGALLNAAEVTQSEPETVEAISAPQAAVLDVKPAASEPNATTSAVTEPVVAVSVVPAASAPVAAVSVQSAPATQAVLASLVSASSPVASGLPRAVLSFEGDSWVEVRDASDKVVFARLNQTGVVQEVQGAGPLFLVIGNAQKVRLSWKGKPVELAPYIKGDVARVTVQ